MFAFEDGQKSYKPRAIGATDRYEELPDDVWKNKYEIITKFYGFDANGFEAEITPSAALRKEKRSSLVNLQEALA